MSGPPLVLRGGRVLDPGPGLDRRADVTVVDGRVAEVGGAVAVPDGAQVVDVGGLLVTPGWVDLHTHVFGDIGLADPDTAGVRSGVTTVVDAGSSGSLTVDELLTRGLRLESDVRAIAFLDRRGIANVTTIPTSPTEIPPVPVGELCRAVERWGDRIVAVKTGVYSDLSVAWHRLAVQVAELVERPLFVHVGNFATHRSADRELLADLCRTLRPGDIVTHCYTGAPGGLVDDHGDPLPEALEMAARGVVLDLGHSGGGFSVDVARRCLDAGLEVTTVSSDLAVLNARSRVRSLPWVLSKVSALGFGAMEAVAKVTVAPRAAAGLAPVSVAPGSPADLTVVAWDEGEVAFEDTEGVAFTGTGTWRPVLAVRAGRLHHCDTGAITSEGNLRFKVVDPPGAPRSLPAGAADLLRWLARFVEVAPPDGELVQLALLAAAAERGLGPDVAPTAVFRAFADRSTGDQVGWFVAEQVRRAGAGAVAARLRAGADGLEPLEARRQAG